MNVFAKNKCSVKAVGQDDGIKSDPNVSKVAKKVNTQIFI